MTFVTTDCPSCGTVEVPLDDVVLRVCEDDDRARLAVRCSACGTRFSKRVDDGMNILLVTVGVTVETWQRPAEVDERPLHHPPIRFDELEAFVAELRATDSVLELLGVDRESETRD